MGAVPSSWATARPLVAPWPMPSTGKTPHLQALSSLPLLFASTHCSASPGALFGSLHDSTLHKGVGVSSGGGGAGVWIGGVPGGKRGCEPLIPAPLCCWRRSRLGSASPIWLGCLLRAAGQGEPPGPALTCAEAAGGTGMSLVSRTLCSPFPAVGLAGSPTHSQGHRGHSHPSQLRMLSSCCPPLPWSSPGKENSGPDPLWDVSRVQSRCHVPLLGARTDSQAAHGLPMCLFTRLRVSVPVYLCHSSGATAAPPRLPHPQLRWFPRLYSCTYSRRCVARALCHPVPPTSRYLGVTCRALSDG